MNANTALIYVALLLTLTYFDVTNGHGGMTEPPMRSVAWKYGFDTPVNYDWMSLYCGGLDVFTKNNGTCGLCGDAYTGPFENDKGGVYDTGVIVRHYPAGLREIEVKVEMTAHHKGYFQFKLCPNNAEELTKGCLDRYPLLIREGAAQGDPTRYYPPKEPKLNELHVRLPQGVICDRCVLQWTYTAGNSLGREIQETFVNCADISIGGSRDRIPVMNKRPIEGEVVVIEQRPDITAIIDRSPPGSLVQVLSALTGGSETKTVSQPSLPVNNEPTSVRERRMRNDGQLTSSDHGFLSDIASQMNGNIDPRMFHPRFNEFEPNHSFPSNFDTPGITRDDASMANFPRRPGMNNFRNMMPGGWPQNEHIPNAGILRSRAQMTSHRRNSFIDGQLHDQTRPANIPPPSRVWVSNHKSADDREGVINDKGTHSTLLDSVGSIVGQISKDKELQGGRSVTHQQTRTVPSRQFVQRMTDLRRAFPNSHEWRRGDGRWSHSHAVRPSPMLDTHDFTTGEIRIIVPSLPANIGLRRDMPNTMDPRFNPEMAQFRNNWFPDSQFLMQQQRMHMINDQRPATTTRLPRRIEVNSMSVAQHLLRKYPQLRGRVFLSRQGHLRNKFSHMMNKYARRQNWSGP